MSFNPTHILHPRRKTRGADDIYNSFFAGNVAGMVGAFKLRNPRGIIISGASSITCVLFISSISDVNLDIRRAG